MESLWDLKLNEKVSSGSQDSQSSFRTPPPSSDEGRSSDGNNLLNSSEVGDRDTWEAHGMSEEWQDQNEQQQQTVTSVKQLAGSGRFVSWTVLHQSLIRLGRY